VYEKTSVSLKNRRLMDHMQRLNNSVVEDEEESVPEKDADDEIKEMEEETKEDATSCITLYCGSVFDRHIKGRLKEAVEGVHHESSILVAMDIPYFITRLEWDNPEFVGVDEDVFLDQILLLLKNIVLGHQGMVIIFGSDVQCALLKDKFSEQRQKKIGFNQVYSLT